MKIALIIIICLLGFLFLLCSLIVCCCIRVGAMNDYYLSIEKGADN